MFVAMTLLTVTGCGDSTSVEKPIESKEEVAVYINDLKASDDELKISKLIQSTTTYEEVGIGTEDISESKEENKLEKSTSSSFYKSTLKRVVEDAEHSTTNGWRVYDNSPEGATISNVYDNDKESRVIEVTGSASKNGFYLSLGDDVNNRTIKWSMKYSEGYVVYVRIHTKKGFRYLYYTPTNSNYGKANAPYAHYIHHGLGSNSKNGTWQTFTRNLTKDLKEFENDNTILSVEGFYLRGSGKVDDIEFIEPDLQNSNGIIYEDSESQNNSKWKVYDKSPVGGTIANVYDNKKKSNVIKLTGNGLKNGYVLSEFQVSKGWHQRSFKNISWSMNYGENFVVYISVVTEKGHRYLYYTPSTRNHGKANAPYAHYIHHGLGSSSKNRTWQTFSRDLEADLKEFEPDNNLISTEAFLIRGSGSVDDIMMGENGEDSIDDEDKVAPVITLNGEERMTLIQGSRYLEQNATAIDAIDGEVTVVISGEVDTSTVGTYIITYSAKDKANNSSSKSRTISVIKKVVEVTLNLEANTTELNLGKTILLTVKNGETKDVSSDVEWTVSPSDSAEISNNILTAKKEGNVTIEAKYQGKTSNKLSFDVRWVINGHVLPLEPDDIENNATLGGVDVNNNGVRDDVERKIREKYAKPLHSALLIYEAKFYQRTLVESTSNAIEIQKDATRTIDCEMYLGDFDKQVATMDWMKNSKYIKNLTFNNLERVEKYLKYNLALSGGSYGSSFEDENIGACSPEVVNVLKEIE
jgi:hypothetical protein